MVAMAEDGDNQGKSQEVGSRSGADEADKSSGDQVVNRGRDGGEGGGAGYDVETMEVEKGRMCPSPHRSDMGQAMCSTLGESG